MTAYVESVLINQPNNEKLIRGDRYGNVCTTTPADGIPKQYFCSTTGNSTGTFNAIGNYSGAATDFYVESVSRYEVHSLLVNVTSGANFHQSDYGSLAAPTIANGVKLFVKPLGAAEIPLLSGYAVKTNSDWTLLTRDTILTSFAGTSQTLVANFNITEDYGKPIMLELGDRFIIRLQDNFTGLINNTFGLRGILF